MSQTFALPWALPRATPERLRGMHFQTEARLLRTLVLEAYASIRRVNIKPMARAKVTLHLRSGVRREWEPAQLYPTVDVVVKALVRASVIDGPGMSYVPHVGVTIVEPQPGKPAAMWITLEEVCE